MATSSSSCRAWGSGAAGWGSAARVMRATPPASASAQASPTSRERGNTDITREGPSIIVEGCGLRRRYRSPRPARRKDPFYPRLLPPTSRLPRNRAWWRSGQLSPFQDRQQVAHLLALGLKVLAAVGLVRGDDRHLVD